MDFFFLGGGGSIGGKGEPLRFVRMGFRGPELQPFHLFELRFSRPRFPLSFLAACSPKSSPSVRQQPGVSEKQDAAAKSNAEQHGQAPPETPVKASASAAEEVDAAAEEFAAQESSASVG